MEPIVGRYNKIKQAAEGVRSGELSAEEFEQFLSSTYDLLSAKGNECRTIIDEENYAEESPDEVGEGLGGLDLYEAGLQEMYHYLEDGDFGHLDEGLAMIWEGNEKINKAMALNREGREDLDLAFMM